MILGGVSFTTPPPAPSTLVEQVISLRVPRAAHHSYCHGGMDSELFLLRMTLIQLTNRVQYLEDDRDVK